MYMSLASNPATANPDHLLPSFTPSVRDRGSGFVNERERQRQRKRVSCVCEKEREKERERKRERESERERRREYAGHLNTICPIFPDHHSPDVSPFTASACRVPDATPDPHRKERVLC